MRLNGKELDDLNPNELVDVALDCMSYVRLELLDKKKMIYDENDIIFTTSSEVDHKLYNLRELVRNVTQET